MKISFYGPTEKAAEKKASSFVKLVKKAEENLLVGRQVNVTSINRKTFKDPNCVVKAYKYCARIEYNLSPK